MFGYRVLGFGSGGAGAATYEVDYLVIAAGGGKGQQVLITQLDDCLDLLSGFRLDATGWSDSL